jgi:hypothetical protein
MAFPLAHCFHASVRAETEFAVNGPTLLVICIFLPLLPACARAQPTSAPSPAGLLLDDRPLAIAGVRADRVDMPCFGRVELSVDLRGTFANPFDPAEIELNGLLTTPKGKRLVVPGFYTRTYSRRLQGDQEQLTPRGKPGWRLRVCATEPGEYKLVAVARDRTGKQVSAAPVTFTARASSKPGIIRRDPENDRYFVFDNGSAYVPIGANVCWGGGGGTFSYDRWFARYGGAGCNYSRLWLGPTWTTFGIDGQGIGKIDLANAWRLDYVLNLAEKHGLYLMLCMDSYNVLRYGRDGAHPFWEQTPHNAANGGPLREPGEFWTNTEMLRQYRNRLRYLVARYGAHANVMAWEFWNEVDIVSPAAWDEARVTSWHAQMARYLRGLDPYDHLITTSFSGSGGRAGIDRLPELDFVQTHTYGARDVTDEVLTQQTAKAGYGKPHYVGECGLGDNEGIDKTGINLHNALWSGVFSGGAGTAMLWWWDNHIDPNNLYTQFAPLTRFLREIDPVARGLQPMDTKLRYSAPPRTPLLSDLELPAKERSWQASSANQPTTVWIQDGGRVRIETTLSGLLHGAKNHPALHNPVTLHLDLPRPTQLVVQVSGVSGYGGGHLTGRRNGELVLDKEMPDPDGSADTETLHQYDGAYSIAVPAGPQTVVVDNVGTDWMNVGYVLKDGKAATEPALRVLALAAADSAIAWVQNPQHEWYRVLVEKQAPRPVPPSLLQFPGLSEGRYTVTLWDTYRGSVIQRLPLETHNGSLTIPIPAVSQDLAVKVVREAPASERQARRGDGLKAVGKKADDR